MTSELLLEFAYGFAVILAFFLAKKSKKLVSEEINEKNDLFNMLWLSSRAILIAALPLFGWLYVISWMPYLNERFRTAIVILLSTIFSSLLMSPEFLVLAVINAIFEGWFY